MNSWRLLLAPANERPFCSASLPSTCLSLGAAVAPAMGGPPAQKYLQYRTMHCLSICKGIVKALTSVVLAGKLFM